MFEQEIDISEIRDTYDINVVIVTATPVELEVAKSFLKPIDDQILVSYDSANTYYIGIYGKFLCAIVKTNNMGAIASGAALQTTQDAINTFRPKAVIMAGIALGKSKTKQNLGDLLISKSLVFYEQARVNSDGTVEYRGIKPESNRTLLNRFTQSTNHQYHFDGHDKSVAVVAGPILSGEKLIDSAEFKQELLTQFPDAIGGEMEAAGVYSACNNDNTPWIILKSICDWADGTKEKSFQKESAHIAFSFLNKVLDSSYAFTSLNMSAHKKKRDLPEVNLDASNILPLFVSRRDLDSVLDTQEIIKIYQKKIYYEYFYFKDRGRVEGFLFIGKNVTITNTLEHFVAKFKVPDILNLYVNKKYNNNGQIDRISHIDKECSKRGLSNKIYDGVSYLEEVIWDATLKSYLKEEHHRRSDYIDQDLFTYFQEPENLGQGIDYFKGVLSDKFGSSISVIFGRGGVGKTTFCDALKNEIDTGDNKKGVFLIKGEQISNLVNFNDIYIESILDLFEAFKVESNLSTLSKSDFSLNYSCGNILVIIDGLDEIDSALGERFNLEKFFSSLSDLDDRFHNTKIILTTRDYFEKNIVSASPLIRKFKLKGFTEKDIEKYKRIKLSKDIQKENFDKLLEVNKLKNNGFSLPVIINLACQAVLDSPDEHMVQDYQSESDFLIGTHVYDSILEYMLTREIDKQKLNTTVDGLFQLLSEIVIDHKNKMSINDLNEYVELTFNENGDKFLKNPLFNVRDNFLSIKEEALTSLIKSRYLIYLLRNDISRYEKISNILKDSYKGSGDIYNTLREFVSTTDSGFESNAIKLIKKLKESEVKSELNYDKVKYRKAISSLLYSLLSNRPSFDKNERSNYIYKLLGGKNNIIDGLHIYGDFYSLSFDHYKVMNSSFNEYNKLSDCHFGKENEYVFSFCSFSNINIAKVGYLKNCLFENSCKFDKCNIVNLLDTKSDVNKKKKENIKSNIISIAKYIGTTQRSLNLIKLNTTVNWNKSHKGFIDELKKLGFIQVDKNGHFRLNSDYYDDLPHINLGRFPRTLNNIVDCLAK